jgi:exopolysaccharide biosynthesis WecB/TagA/CpsF family protein
MDAHIFTGLRINSGGHGATNREGKEMTAVSPAPAGRQDAGADGRGSVGPVVEAPLDSIPSPRAPKPDKLQPDHTSRSADRPLVVVDDSVDRLPVENLARLLAADLARGIGGTVTWLNHYSALQSLRAGVPIDQFDYLGLDGILLCRLVRSGTSRTSADLLLPALLEQTGGLRIALIGSTAETLRTVAAKVAAEYGHDVVLMRDGYSELPDPAELRRELQAARVQVAIVGLGAPLQDLYSLALKSPGVLVMTCGGWLDQFAGGTYYPAWAYPLRLNWLVRLAREPRRLWRRYTVDAVRAFRARADLIHYVTGVGRRPLAAAGSEAQPSVPSLPAA